MTVTNTDPDVPGTENNPYTVEQAIANTPSSGNVYIHGIVSAFHNTSIVGDGSNYRYYISDDGTTSSQLLVYKGKGLNEETFTSADDLMVGDVVTIYGSLITYQNAPEVASGNYLVSHSRPVNTEPSIALVPATLTPTAAEADGTISIAYDNLTISDAVDFAIQFYNSNNEEINDAPAWIEAEITKENDNYYVSYVIGANKSEEARSAYFKVWALDDNTEIVYSNLVTITQAAYVVDYATLPFEWDSKTAPTGVTTSGTGTYNSSPYIQFDSTGDYLILKINEEPGTLTFDIKGNSFSGGTFKVQTSADGTIYSDLKSYTSLGNTQSEVFEDLASSVRYIKWIYTNKSSGNVALGNIALAKYVAPSTDPAISAEDVNIGCNDTEGSISFTISNPVDGGGVTASKDAGWLTLGAVSENAVAFTCSANTGDVRSATVTLTYTYNTNQTVTKDVTVTQAAYVVTTKWALTDLSDLTADDVFIIVENSGSTSYALSNNNGTTSAPSAVAVDVSDSTWEGVIADDLMWNMQKINDSYVFYPNGSTDTWLYCTNTNNGVRVGTNDNNKLFSLVNGYLFNSATSRYVGVYSAQDWRCYDNTTGNIAGQSFAFYKQVVSSGVATSVTVTCKPNGGRNWGTFYSGQAQYVIPDNVPAKAYTMNSAHQLYLLGENGHIIPKGVAVIIISDVESVTLNAVFKGSASVSNTNILVGSDTAVENNGKQYVLGIKDGVLKFYSLDSIAVPAGKAYYVNE